MLSPFYEGATFLNNGIYYYYYYYYYYASQTKKNPRTSSPDSLVGENVS